MPRLLGSILRTSFVLLSGLTTLLLFSVPRPACAVPYTFTKIDEQVEPGTIFGLAPTINNSGTVAFGSSRSNGSLQTGSGGPLTTLSIPKVGELFLTPVGAVDFMGAGRAWINDQGEVAFRGAIQAPPATTINGEFFGEGIFTIRAHGPLTMVATTFGAPFQGFLDPVVNSKGATAFFASLDGNPGSASNTSGIFVAKGGTVTKLVDTSSLALQGIPVGISMNARGDVAFTSGTEPGVEGVFVSRGGVIKKIADTTGRFAFLGFPSINEKGEVAFWASLKSGGEGIFVARGNRLIRVADTRGSFESFKRPDNLFQGFSSGFPVLSTNGTVAFWASLDTGGGGIFSTCIQRACRGKAPTEVIGIGDTLFGHTVSFLDLLDGGINDTGQIAFHAQEVTDVNGVNLESFDGIYRADPSLSSTPEPTTLLLFGTTAAGLGVAAWRRLRQA